MALTWTEDLNTGIDIIDQQHQRIVLYINQLEEAVLHHDRHLVGEVLDELLDYTLSHFAFEESLQEEAGYDRAEAHKDIHDFFARRVHKYRQHHQAGDDVAEQLLDMLHAWLVQHIKREDMGYVPQVTRQLAARMGDRRPESWLERTLRRFFK